jgi:hypothetical protein
MSIIDIRIDAINSLAPNAKYMTAGNEITWMDDDVSQPTEEAIAAEVVRLQGLYDNKSWERNRIAAYALLNQDEMRYDDIINSTTTWVDAINAIKLEHPKSE